MLFFLLLHDPLHVHGVVCLGADDPCDHITDFFLINFLLTALHAGYGARRLAAIIAILCTAADDGITANTAVHLFAQGIILSNIAAYLPEFSAKRLLCALKQFLGDKRFMAVIHNDSVFLPRFYLSADANLVTDTFFKYCAADACPFLLHIDLPFRLPFRLFFTNLPTGQTDSC